MLQLAGHRKSRAIAKRAVDYELPAEVCTPAGRRLPRARARRSARPGARAGRRRSRRGRRPRRHSLRARRSRAGRAQGRPQARPPVDHAGLELGQPLQQGDVARASGPAARLERAPGARGRRVPRDPGRARARTRRRQLRPVLRGSERDGGTEPDRRPPAPAVSRLLAEGRPRRAAVFARWLAAVRASADERVRTAEVVVRPHPASPRWEDWTPPDGVRLSLPGAKIETARLSQLLVDADAVVALNTSAEIEAAITGTPVLTFRAGDDARGQEGSLHFRYLLEEHGGFVARRTGHLPTHVEQLAAVLRGAHDPEPARSFVESFVRPRGARPPGDAAARSRDPRPRIAAASRPNGHGRPAAPGARTAARAGSWSSRRRCSSRRCPTCSTSCSDPGCELLFSGRSIDRAPDPGRARRAPERRRRAAAAGARAARARPRTSPARSSGRLALSGRVARRRLLGAGPRAPQVLQARRPSRLEAHAFRVRRPRSPAPGRCTTPGRAPPGGGLRAPTGAAARGGRGARRRPRSCSSRAARWAATRRDVIKTARLLGIPSILLVWSWDNLSSKAVLHEHPGPRARLERRPGTGGGGAPRHPARPRGGDRRPELRPLLRPGGGARAGRRRRRTAHDRLRRLVEERRS